MLQQVFCNIVAVVIFALEIREVPVSISGDCSKQFPRDNAKSKHEKYILVQALRVIRHYIYQNNFFFTSVLLCLRPASESLQARLYFHFTLCHERR